MSTARNSQEDASSGPYRRPNGMRPTPNEKNSVVALAEEVEDELVSNIKQNMFELIESIQKEQVRMGDQTKSLQEALEKARIREEDHQRELEILRQEKRNIILENAAEGDERLDVAQIENEEKLDQLRSVISDMVIGKRELKRQLEEERATVAKLKFDIAALQNDKENLEYQLHEAETETQVAYDFAEAKSASTGKWEHECARLRVESQSTAKKNAEKVSDLEQRLKAASEEMLKLAWSSRPSPSELAVV